jgi:hypothetical protein
MKQYWVELRRLREVLFNDFALLCLEMGAVMQKLRECQIREGFYNRRMRRVVGDTQQELDRLLVCVQQTTATENKKDEEILMEDVVENDSKNMPVIAGFENAYLSDSAHDYAVSFPRHLYQRSDINLVYHQGTWGFWYLDDFIPIPNGVHSMLFD